MPVNSPARGLAHRPFSRSTIHQPATQPLLDRATLDKLLDRVLVRLGSDKELCRTGRSSLDLSKLDGLSAAERRELQSLAQENPGSADFFNSLLALDDAATTAFTMEGGGR